MFNPHHSCFKTASSIDTAPLLVTESLRANRASSLSSVLIFLDLSAAFDTELLDPPHQSRWSDALNHTNQVTLLLEHLLFSLHTSTAKLMTLNYSSDSLNWHESASQNVWSLTSRLSSFCQGRTVHCRDIVVSHHQQCGTLVWYWVISYYAPRKSTRRPDPADLLSTTSRGSDTSS